MWKSPLIHYSDEETNAQGEERTSQGHTARDGKATCPVQPLPIPLCHRERGQEPVPQLSTPLRGVRGALGLYLSAAMGDCVDFNIEGLGGVVIMGLERWQSMGRGITPSGRPPTPADHFTSWSCGSSRL